MKNLINKYKILFFFSFVISRGFPLFVMIGASIISTETFYIFLENSIALSQLFVPFLSIGIISVINILKNKEYALKIVNRHVQIVSLFLLILSGCLTLNNRYELSALINTTNIFLHIGNFANHLKITEKRISALFIENTLYYLIFIHIFFYVYVNIFLIEFYLFYTVSLFGACIVLLLYNIKFYNLNIFKKFKKK